MGHGWVQTSFLVPLAITIACWAGAWIAWEKRAGPAPTILLALLPLAVIPVALRVPPWRRRCIALTCASCGSVPQWKERAVGLPVESTVLREGAASPVVAAIARADWTHFEGAQPPATIEAWIQNPALFLSLGSCPRCDRSRLISIEVHGLDDKGVLRLGPVQSAEVTREDEQRLLSIARRQGLMTYGHA